MLRNRLALATLLVLQVGWFVGAVAPQARQLQLIVPEAGCDTDMIDDLTEDLNRACCPAATCHDAAPTRCSAGCALAMATAFGGGCRDTLGRLSEAVTTLWQVCLALPPEEVAAAIAPTCGGAVPLPPPPPTPPPPPPPPLRPPPPPPAPVFSGGCTSYPCQNGGQCVEEAGAVYRCQCTTGFAGDDCEDNQSSSADDQISHDTADDRCYPCPHYVPNGNEIPCDDWMVGCMVQCSDCSCQSTAGTCPRPAGGGHRRTQAGGSRTEAILEAYTGDAATACAAIGMAPADGAKGAGDACCGAGTSLYVTASSDCLRGEWILGGSPSAPTWESIADRSAFIGWRSDLHDGIWTAAIGSSYIDCDWGEQNVQDYGSDVNHPVGCMEGNVAPPAGTPASCTRWQGNFGYGSTILPVDFSVGECRQC